jgi:hypothetical protein
MKIGKKLKATKAFRKFKIKFKMRLNKLEIQIIMKNILEKYLNDYYILKFIIVIYNIIEI